MAWVAFLVCRVDVVVVPTVNTYVNFPREVVVLFAAQAPSSQRLTSGTAWKTCNTSSVGYHVVPRLTRIKASAGCAQIEKGLARIAFCAGESVLWDTLLTLTVTERGIIRT